MKKLFAAIIGITLMLFVATIVIAQEIESSPSASISPSPSPSIEYTLPYPGLLPDHPLYGIKTLRDRIVLVLIADPIKRVEFNLLMADKRLNMGIFLSEKGKERLAESTISKGEKYLSNSTEYMVQLYNKDRTNSVLASVIDRLTQSAKKHEKVITNLKKKAPDAQKDGYDQSLIFIEESLNRIEELK